MPPPHTQKHFDSSPLTHTLYDKSGKPRLAFPVVSKMAAPCMTDSEADEEFEVIALATAIIIASRPRRRLWAREWVLQRPYLGAYATLMQELVNEDLKATKAFLRMSYDHFQVLVEKVSPLIARRDTVMRRAISPGERLAVTLRYLGSGNSFIDLSFLFRIPDNTIHNIVLETCDALHTVLKDEYLKVPDTQQEWMQVARDFEMRWDFPNCIGAIDGKHIEIQSTGGSDYFNYLKYHSIILLAVVDARYRFLFVDVGTNGRAGDAGVFQASSLKAALDSKALNIPPPVPLPGRHKPIEYFFVGDDAFPLRSCLMKPFPFRTVTDLQCDKAEEERRQRRIFDYRLSRARRLSENAFGILAMRFGVFRTCMRLSPDKATRVTLAAIVLHNFMMTTNDTTFLTPTLCDREDPTSRDVTSGDWRRNRQQLDELMRIPVNRSAVDARAMRDEIKEYVNGVGRVPWQERIVFAQFLGT